MQIARDIEKYTKDYVAVYNDFEQIMVQYRRKKVLEILQHYQPKHILEIGCGTDSIANYYTSFDEFVIVEPSKDFAQLAANIPRVQVHIDFVENKIGELKKHNFDFIILSSLLHEVTDPTVFLCQILPLCHSNTVLHINVPNARSFHLLWAYASGLTQQIGQLTPRAQKMQRHTTFDLNKLTQMCTAHNLKIIDSGSYFIKPFNHTKMQQLVQSGMVDTTLLDGLYQMTQYLPENGAEIFVNCQLL